MGDLFDYQPPARYPDAPGFKEGDTSRKAAESVAPTAPHIRAGVLASLRAAGRGGLTPDECAADLGLSVLSVRPRFTELSKSNKIHDGGERRKNASGRAAKVWRYGPAPTTGESN